MKVLQRLCAASVIALATVIPASAQEGPSAQGMLAIAKMAGACGILDSMIQFQGTTRMEGGEAFVLRFWQVEAARLGMTVEELSEKCGKSVSAYDKLWGAFETNP